MKEPKIDRLIALLKKDQSGEIENITKAGNTDNTLSIAFKDGEVLVLTAETEVSDEVASGALSSRQ
jgi:hypothetical protein